MLKIVILICFQCARFRSKCVYYYLLDTTLAIDMNYVKYLHTGLRCRVMGFSVAVFYIAQHVIYTA